MFNTWPAEVDTDTRSKNVQEIFLTIPAKNSKEVHCTAVRKRYDNGLLFEIFNTDDLEKFLTNTENNKGSDDYARDAYFAKTLVDKGNVRELKQLDLNWREQLDTIEQNFPHAAELLDYVRTSAALVEGSTAVLDLDSILLEGAPGCGKSYLSEILSNFIDSGSKSIKMESAQSSSMICGSDAFWSNSKSGAVLDLLVNGRYANPVVLIDELDKISVDRFDPAGPLLSLLEKWTAAKFTDLCHPWLRLDASKLTWIMTCNQSEGKISAPLLSRMRRFVIEQPDEHQSMIIAKNIIAGVMEEFSPSTDGVRFSEAALAAICRLSPRKMRAEAKLGLGRVLYRQQGNIVLETDVACEAPRRRMGFV